MFLYINANLKRIIFFPVTVMTPFCYQCVNISLLGVMLCRLIGTNFPGEPSGFLQNIVATTKYMTLYLRMP